MLSTPDVPKSNSEKGKGQKPRRTKKQGKRGKISVVAVVAITYTSGNEELKNHMFTTGPTINKTFLTSREKFLGDATEKFGVDITYSLAKRSNY